MKFFHNIEPTLKSNPKQSFIGIWFHDDNLTDDQINQMELYLNQTFYYYRVFNNMKQFSSYINEEQLVAKICFIISISDSSLNALVDLIRKCSKTEKFYTFLSAMTFMPICFNTNDIDDLFKEIFKDINYLLTKTKTKVDTEFKPMNISRTNEISTSSSKFISKSNQITPIRHLTKESIGFLSFLTMVKILLDIPHNTDEITDMWQACRSFYETDSAQLEKIENLLKEYTSDKAINYYTKSTFFFIIINQACRTENVQRIYEFRVYISDLHQDLNKLCKQQEEEDGIKSKVKKVWRGKVLSTSVLQQLIDNKQGLISMNGFLSTTMSPEIADIYSAVGENIDDGDARVQFALTIDTIKQPYAWVSSCSATPDEEEILFSLGTIWRIESIELINGVYQVELVSHNNLDSHLDTLLENYTRNGCNLSSVGDVLRELGNYDEAEWFYNKVLEQPYLSDETRGHLYYNMGIMQEELDRNSKAHEYFEEAAHLLKSSTAKSNEIKSPREIYINSTELTLVAVYNNMGFLHDKNYDFNNAVNCYKQALEVNDGSRLEMAIVNNNLGCLYSRYGNYKQARNYHATAVELVDENQSYWGDFKRNLADVENILNT